MSPIHLLAIDQQRSVLNGNGSASTGKAYTPYGFAAIQEGAISAFGGESRDTLTGCYHLGNGYRQYNPVIMRFHSSDQLSPFGAGGLNAYMYCEADPVNRLDPSGAIGLQVVQTGAAAALNALLATAQLATPAPRGPIARNAARASFAGALVGFGSVVAGAAGASVPPVIPFIATVAAATGAGGRVINFLYSNKTQLIAASRRNIGANFSAMSPFSAEKVTPQPLKREYVSVDIQTDLVGITDSEVIVNKTIKRTDTKILIDVDAVRGGDMNTTKL